MGARENNFQKNKEEKRRVLYAKRAGLRPRPRRRGALLRARAAKNRKRRRRRLHPLPQLPLPLTASLAKPHSFACKAAQLRV
jgi:hypothetical protein